MDRLIDKIITFGKIHELRNKCIHKVSLFGDFGGAIGLFFLENAGRAIDDVRYRDVII